MTLTDAQHDRIKEIVLMAIWGGMIGEIQVPYEEQLKHAMHFYETNREFFALVNCTVQRIVEVLENKAPSAVTPDRSLPPCEPSQPPPGGGRRGIGGW